MILVYKILRGLVKDVHWSDFFRIADNYKLRGKFYKLNLEHPYYYCLFYPIYLKHVLLLLNLGTAS